MLIASLWHRRYVV